MATEYEISIPGASKIFKFGAPPNRTEAQTRAIIQRAREKSPMPGFLQWVPRVINMLDDAQDILITGLTLAKPLLRRLPLRFVPVLGWVLLANDVLNLSTAILSTGIGGAYPKKIAKNVMQFYAKGRFVPTSGVKRFLGATPKLAFALQAAQASETITGYGLSLGGIMGMITDSFWGIFRTAQGRKVTITTPPPLDPFSKAARYLIQTFGMYWHGDIFTKEDEMALLCAKKVAIDILAEGTIPFDVESRMSQADEIIVPNIRPWNDISRRALIAEGVDPDVDQLPLALVGDVNSTFGDVVLSANRDHLRSQNSFGGILGETEDAVINQLVLDEGGIQVTEWLQRKGLQYVYDFDNVQKMVMRSAELGVWPATFDSRWWQLVLNAIRGSSLRIDLFNNLESVISGEFDTLVNAPAVERMDVVTRQLMVAGGREVRSLEDLEIGFGMVAGNVAYTDPFVRQPDEPVASPVRIS